MNNIEVKKRRRVAAVLAFILPFIFVAGATAFLMSCSNPTGGDTKKPQDLVFTYKNITVTIDASVKNNYPQATIDEFKGYLQELYAAQDALSVNTVAYINSKPSFKIDIKPLTGALAANEYNIISASELVINSTVAISADDLLSGVYDGVAEMQSLSNAGQLSKTI